MTETDSSGKAAVTVYEYDMRNRLQAETKTAGDTAETLTYRYDYNGNQVHRQWERFSPAPEKAAPGRAGFTTDEFKESVVILEMREYSGLNELAALYRDGYETRYTYRPDGLRHKKLFADGTTATHIWDGQSMVAEYAGSGSTTARYLRGIDLIAREQDEKLQYYLYNAHGDVVQRTDEHGTALKSYEYSAFGNEQTPEALDANPFRYCGEYYDREAETPYLRARSYSARTGRFTREDPARDGLNWYIYCGNNPIMFVDPFGLIRMDTKTMLDELGVDIYYENEDTIFAQFYNENYGGINMHLLDREMDSADFAKLIGLDNRFGSYNSNLAEDKTLLYLRSEYANILLRNGVDSFALNSNKEYYLLDYNGYTIQMQMTSRTIHVNMELGNAGDLSLTSERYGLAQWLKDTYKLQYKQDYFISRDAIGEELYWHSWTFRNTDHGTYWNEHARNADIGDEYSFKSYWWERAAWDMLGGLSPLWK